MSSSRNSVLPPGCYYQSSRGNTVRTVHTWTAQDGAQLNAIHHYNTDMPYADHLFIYLHGIESHAAWFDEAADELCSRGCHVYCLDRRGSGLNGESQGYVSGHVDSFEILLDDLDYFIQLQRANYAKVIVIGLSWGAKLAIAHALTRSHLPDGIVFVTPGLVARVTLPLTTRFNILISTFIRPTKQFPIPIKPEMFTSDPFFLERMSIDPLRLQSVSARFYFESLRLEKLIKRRIASNTVPLACFFAGRDRIIDNDRSHQLLIPGGAPGLHVVTYEDQVHSIQFDAPERLAGDIYEWMKARGLLS